MPQSTGRGRGAGVVVAALTTATTALLSPTASADTPDTPIDLTCAVTSAGLPGHLAWTGVPAALLAGPTGTKTPGAAVATPRGELTLHLPGRVGDLLAPYAPAARTVAEGLTVTVEITSGGAVADGREFVLTTVRDPATTPLPGLVLPPVEFTCRAPAAPTPVPVAAYQSPGADPAGSLGSGSLDSGSASAGAPAGQDAAPSGPKETVVSPGAASAPQAVVAPAPQGAAIVSTSGTGGRAATTTTTPTTGSTSTTRADNAASAITPTAAAIGTAHAGPAAATSAGDPVHDLAGAQLLAAESPRSLNTEPETGVSVSLPALLWTTGGIILLSLLYALWTSVRLRRLKALAADRAAEA